MRYLSESSGIEAVSVAWGALGWQPAVFAADEPRYGASGKSMAIPVIRWIGERIAAVDAILREERGSEGVG